ncbi:MAG: response regulator transcription factor [Bacteroidetes bacterium]|nr:response regulator transcription factor [Bacteroidota bacterium]
MAGKLILLVEDENNLATVIKLNLELEGYSVIIADNGQKSIEVFKNQNPDLVILDIMLPELNGIEACKQMKKINSETPILFLSAKSSGADKIEGLKSGGDDYLTKPFNLEELLLRVQILLKRHQSNAKEDKYILSNFSIDFNTFEITDNSGKKIDVPNREMKLLKLLISKEGQVVSRTEIMQQLWNPSENPSARTIDNYILNFRKIFELESSENKYFHSIRGVGYKFTKN